MKICFLLQRRFAYIGHDLAIILKNKYGARDFCGYVSQRSSYNFLINQKDIAYTSLILDEEIHETYKNEVIDWDFLKKLEREYGIPNLWPHIAIDRVVMQNQLVREYPYDTPPYKYEEILKIFQVKAKTIIEFLEREKPDVVFTTIVAAIGSSLLYYIAKKKNINVIIIETCRVRQNWILTEDYKRSTYVEKKYDELMAAGKESQKIEEARQYLADFQKKHSTYLHYSMTDLNKNYRLNPLKWLKPKNIWRSLSWFLKFSYNYYVAGKNRDFTDEKPVGYLIDRVKRKIRTAVGFSNLYDKPDFKENYGFYPLHYEPEVGVSLYAPNWTDQVNLVRQIAKSLPIDYRLYVKEHPAMVGYRPKAYYKELKKIPNIKLIEPNIPSYDLVKNADIVFVIASTAGWEAILLQKPLVTFGDVFYNKLSTVKKCDNIAELPYLIKTQLENFNYRPEELENFIGCVMEESADIGLTEIWEKGTRSSDAQRKLELLADLMAKKLNLKQIS
ncbi:MAG: hypothetical protein Q8O93_03560 [bacterium]|nr:hypothetical protein [bacterium]